MNIKLLILIIFSVLTGCVSQPTRVQLVNIPQIDWSNPLETKKRVRLEIDEFTKTTTFIGPNAINYDYYKRGLETLGQEDLFIRAWREKEGGVVEYQIYTHSLSGDWRFFHSAFDSDGNNLDITIIAEKAGTCLTGSGVCPHEYVGVNVTEEYLKQHINSGIRFKVIGKQGDEVYILSGPYIKGFLSAVVQ